MPYIPLEDLSKNANSFYKLVLMAAERANQILNGSKPVIDTISKKHTTIALREICAGKVSYKETDGKE
ncbi:MAG: DNA-directed RNA polymerase subunit omega [Candidatus Omnitrophica bacterium]|nr:DNA-directed RNA polymerase subunit omega [Candidatus Omnitrophota bacterium]